MPAVRVPLRERDLVGVQLSGDQVEGAVQVLADPRVGEPGAEVLEAAVAGGDRGRVGARRRDQGLGECAAAGLGGGRRDLAPGRSRAADRVALPARDVQVREHLDVVVVLDALGADGGADPAGEADQRLDQRHPHRVGVDGAGQLQVELDDVGADPHDLLEPGVAGAGVVDRDPGAALAELRQRVREQAVADVDLVLGELDDHVGEVVGEDALDGLGGERRRADVDGDVRSRRASERSQRGLDRGGLELGAEPAGVGLREPGRGRAVRRVREAREGLVADQPAGGERGDGLVERLDRPLLEDALDLRALRGVAAEPDVVGVEAPRPRLAGALRPVEGALGELEERRRRRRRRRGRRRRRRSRLSSEPAGESRAIGGPDPLGDLLRRLGRGAGQDQGELLAAGAGGDVASPDRSCEAAPRLPPARRRRRGGRVAR